MTHPRLVQSHITKPLMAFLKLQQAIDAGPQTLWRKGAGKLLSVVNIVFVQGLYHCVFPREMRFGPHLIMPHPFGIILTPHVRLGARVKLMQFVTIGVNEHDESAMKAPLIIVGDDVYIGAGATLIGNALTIGQGAVIGAGAVVTKNVAPHTVVAGVPARTIKTLKKA
jgi:serine acetyltransferase